MVIFTECENWSCLGKIYNSRFPRLLANFFLYGSAGRIWNADLELVWNLMPVCTWRPQCLYKILPWGGVFTNWICHPWGRIFHKLVTPLCRPHNLDLFLLCTALCSSELNWLSHSYFLCLFLGSVSAAFTHTLSLPLVPEKRRLDPWANHVCYVNSYLKFLWLRYVSEMSPDVNH